MGLVVSSVELMVLDIVSALPWSVEQWAESLKTNAERIKTKIDTKIPNSDEFSAKLAGPSSAAYREVLNPAFVSRSGLDTQEIVASQYANLARSFEKYKNQLDFLFETVDGIYAKRFKELVDRAKSEWSKGVSERTLPFTGSRIYELGLSALAGMWLTEDQKTEGYLRAGDKIKVGGPKRICSLMNAPSLRNLLNQRLIQSGATLVKQDWPDVKMTKQNDQTNALINGFLDAYLNIEAFSTTGDSHINWVRIGDKPYLEIQVAVTP